VAYHPASLHPLSIRPASTFVALMLFVTFALLLVGTMRAMRFVRLEWLVGQLMGLGVGLALLACSRRSRTDAPLVYGFWQPAYGAAYGPFINRTTSAAGWSWSFRSWRGMPTRCSCTPRPGVPAPARGFDG
jgi:hypothetical protein